MSSSLLLDVSMTPVLAVFFGEVPGNRTDFELSLGGFAGSYGYLTMPGWRTRIYGLSVSAGVQAAGQTTLVKLKLAGVDISASFGILRADDNALLGGTDSAEPVSSPYEITGADDGNPLTCFVDTTATGGGHVTVTVLGYPYQS